MYKFILASLIAAAWSTDAVAAGAYAGQEARAIKALSAEEVSDLLAGKGGGLSKAAELNGFPGPAHVLALSEGLELTVEQKGKTQRLFNQMDALAKEKGAERVVAERQLDTLFKSRQISPESLTAQLQRVGELQAMVRGAHLSAHIEQANLLSNAQIEQYNELRGYAGKQKQEHLHGGKHE